MINSTNSQNIIYLKDHQHKLIDLESESLAKAALKRIDERWLIEGEEKRNQARDAFLAKFKELSND